MTILTWVFKYGQVYISSDVIKCRPVNWAISKKSLFYVNFSAMT